MKLRMAITRHAHQHPHQPCPSPRRDRSLSFRTQGSVAPRELVSVTS